MIDIKDIFPGYFDIEEVTTQEQNARLELIWILKPIDEASC